jgi:1,4-dihydroxy-2-naphthoate polyprenyltransferase
MSTRRRQSRSLQPSSLSASSADSPVAVVKSVNHENGYENDIDDDGHDGRPPTWKIWWTAARPHTLTASVAPNIVAYSAGMTFLPGVTIIDDDNDDGNITDNNNDNEHIAISYTWIVLQWTVFCILMQLGCNLHNDYADFVKGADNDQRVGQPRATAKGWLSPTMTARAAGGTLFLGLVLGIMMLTTMKSSHAEEWTVVTMMFVVISSIFNAFAYTGGPWPLGYLGLSEDFSLGYSGLGDLFVFLYFGLVATLVPAFVYLACVDVTNDVNVMLNDDPNLSSNIWDIFVVIVPYALQVAVLATNIIIVNNLRDRHTDVVASKRTLAVRFGAVFCQLEYGFMIGIAYGLVICSFYETRAYATLLPLLSFPLACKEWKAIYVKEGRELNAHVGGGAKVQFLFCVLLGLSLRIPEWVS